MQAQAAITNANRSSFPKISDVYSPQQIERTQQLGSLTGSVVELDYSSIKQIADLHFEDLRNSSPTPLRGKSFTLVMGSNGAGKTSQVIPKVLQDKGGAILICTDSVRPKVAQAFRDLKGKGNYQEPLYTQQAARAVSIQCQEKAMVEGLNIIATTVGYNKKGVEGILKIARDNGYAPHLVCASLSPEKAVQRLYTRNEKGEADPAYRERQPFQNPSYTLPSSEYPNTPEDVYDEIVTEPSKYGLASATKYNTDVPPGSEPKIVTQWTA